MILTLKTAVHFSLHLCAYEGKRKIDKKHVHFFHVRHNWKRKNQLMLTFHLLYIDFICTHLISSHDVIAV